MTAKSVREVVYSACYKYAKLKPKLNPTKNSHKKNWEWGDVHDKKNRIVDLALKEIEEIVIPSEEEIKSIFVTIHPHLSKYIMLNEVAKSIRADMIGRVNGNKSR